MAIKNFKDGVHALAANNVTRAELINWLQHQQYEDGTVAKALDELAGLGVISQTNAGVGTRALAVSAAGGGLSGTPVAMRQTLDDYEDIAGTPFVVNVAKLGTRLQQVAVATGTLPNGTFVNQAKRIFLATNGAGYTVTITGTFNGFTSLVFGEYAGGIGLDVVMVWNGTQWHVMGGSAIPVS